MKKVVLIAAGSLVVLLLLAGGLIYMTHRSHLPPELRGTSFSVYYPRRLPSGWAVQPTTAGRTGNLVSFTLINAGSGQNVLVTEGPQDKSFNPSGVDSALSNTVSLSLPYGAGRAGERPTVPVDAPADIRAADKPAKYAYVLTNDNVLIQVSSSAASTTTIQLLLQSFAKG